MVLVVKNPLASPGDVRDTGLIPGSGKSLEKEILQYSYRENQVDRRAWWATVHGVAESDMTEHLSKRL